MIDTYEHHVFADSVLEIKVVYYLLIHTFAEISSCSSWTQWQQVSCSCSRLWSPVLSQRAHLLYQECGGEAGSLVRETVQVSVYRAWEAVQVSVFIRNMGRLYSVQVSVYAGKIGDSTGPLFVYIFGGHVRQYRSVCTLVTVNFLNWEHILSIGTSARLWVHRILSERRYKSLYTLGTNIRVVQGSVLCSICGLGAG